MIPHSNFPYPLYLVISENDCIHHPFEIVLEEAILGGVDIIQLREKDCSNKDFLVKAKRTKAITDRYGIPLIINDNIFVAKEIEAFGVHVGNTDTPPTEVRKLLGSKSIIGYSLEYWEQLESNESLCADYLAASPIFSTTTKTNTVTEWGLEGITKNEMIEKELYDELIDFVDFNTYDWDYEQYFNSIVDETISKSQNAKLLEFYKPLINIDNEGDITITIEKKNNENIFKDFSFIHWLQLILSFPIFIIYIIFASVKKLVNKKFR